MMGQTSRFLIAAAIMMMSTRAVAGDKTRFHIEPIVIVDAEGTYVTGISNRGDLAGVYISSNQGFGFIEKASQV
jgi:hypothetical protein